MPFIDKLLKYFESEAAIIDAQFMADPREIPGYEGFRSCIKFDGEPILPPMVSNLYISGEYTFFYNDSSTQNNLHKVQLATNRITFCWLL